MTGILFASIILPNATAFADSLSSANEDKLVTTSSISSAAPTTGQSSVSGIATTDHSANVTANDVATTLAHDTGILAAASQTKTTSDSDTAIQAVTAGASVEVPRDPNDGVSLGASDGPKLEIQLPNANNAQDATQVAPGTVAYPSGNGSANAVQATEDGGVRMLTVIDNPNAPTKYDYGVSIPEGGNIQIATDGGATITGSDGAVLATVATPWAHDALGRTIETYFTTDDATLTQHIKHNTAGAVYPVTADPSLSWGWNLYVNFNRSETQAIKHFQETGYMGWGLANAGCAPIPNAPARVSCIVATLYEGSQLAWAVRNASETNSCLQLAIPYAAVSNPWMSWWTIRWGWTRC